MKLTLSQIILIFPVIIFSFVTEANGQMEFHGSPIGLNKTLKASESMYMLPPVDPMEVEAVMELNRESNFKPLRFALERSLALSPENHGVWSIENNQKIWRIHLLSPGAFSLGLLLKNYKLLPGVKLFIYDADMQYTKGAFTSGNNKASKMLPVSHLPGEELIIELQLPEGVENYGSMEIASLSHAFLDIPARAEASCPAGQFDCSQDCEIDVNCIEGEGWEKSKASVVRIYIIKTTYSEYCTGTILNNTAYDGKPYILTAEHCIDRQSHATGSVFRFGYESAECFGDVGPTNMEISGSTFLAAGDSLDYGLVELDMDIPASYAPLYSGWDRSDFQTGATTTVHHPWGDVKKISKDEQAPVATTSPSDVPYSGLEDYHYDSYWRILQWDIGTTEGGSSGAALLNAAGRVIGTLSGGAAYCGDSIGYNNGTDRVIYSLAPNIDDYFTRMSKIWEGEDGENNGLSQWLDADNTGSETIGVYNPHSVESHNYAAEKRFRVFPNPARDFIEIQSQNALQGSCDFRLFSTAGVLYMRGSQGESGSARANISALPAGLYILSIGDHTYMEHHKIVITAQ